MTARGNTAYAPRSTNLRLANWLGVVLLTQACKGPPAAEQGRAADTPPVQVVTVSAVSRPMPRYVTLTGTLVADRESDVAADIAGKVLEAPVDRGSTVKANGVLAVLDKRSATISSREATANVDLAREQAEMARLDCARADDLLRNGAIGKAEYDRTKSRCQSTLLSVDAAGVRREAALKQLGDAVIRAPFAGVVSERLIDVGEYVEPRTAVVHLVSVDPLRLRLNVPEQLVGQVHEGMPIELQVSALPDIWFTGTVRYLSAALREQTRDLLVEATVPNAEHKLRPGMFAIARLIMPKAPATVVPEASLHFDGELARLFVSRQGHLEERIVELGTKDSNLVEVRKGVVSGEAVVSPFTLNAKDGAAVAR
jgi:membrane fusion protein (multidrug efflux system)